MDLSVHRNNNNLQLGIYRKPTQIDTTIHFKSNHPIEHKLAAYNFYINRMLTIPITEHARQHEWNTIHTMARNNGFPLQIIHNLKNKLILKTQKTENTFTQTQRKKWITFTCYSPLIHKVTNLLKTTDLNIAFRACNTTYNHLYDRTQLNKITSRGIYKLQCKTCNKSSFGQNGR